MFAGNLALGRTFERERQSETLRALLLGPAPRPAVYVGKLLGILALLAGAEVVLVPLVALLFQARLLAHPLWLVAMLAAGRSGSPPSGRCSPRCSFARAAATCCCRCCCIRLPFQSSLPEFAARRHCCSPSSTSASCGSGSRCWSAFDVVFVTLALWTFEPVMTDLIAQMVRPTAAIACGVMFAASPFVIASAPYESTMGLVQKIFYYHMPSA